MIETQLEHAENMMCLNVVDAMDVIRPYGRPRRVDAEVDESFTDADLKQIEVSLYLGLEAVKKARRLRRGPGAWTEEEWCEEIRRLSEGFIAHMQELKKKEQESPHYNPGLRGGYPSGSWLDSPVYMEAIRTGDYTAVNRAAFHAREEEEYQNRMRFSDEKLCMR